MNEYGDQKSWTALFRTRLQPCPSLLTPLWSSEEDELLLLLDQHVVLLDVKKSALRHPKINNFVAFSGTNVYIESFVSPFQT
uniref:Uncharacterized protein n=1 Tax=Kalanchoe fedtschenkoi TaxID=63787 RepID=A0A7N0U6M9_KALFE